MKVSGLVSRAGSWVRVSLVPMLTLLARYMAPVYATCFTGGSAGTAGGTIMALITEWFAIIQAIIYAVILFGWLSGLLMWSAPSRSMVIKRAGLQQTEISGIALFLVLIGPGIISVITAIAQAVNGSTGYCTPSGT